MIPLMMQKGYKAKGWLGLILGTRMYYNFHGAEVDDDAAFEKRMDAVVREIGDRGKPQLHEAVPPTRAPARVAASVTRPAVSAPAPAPTPAPAPAPAPARALPASPRPVAPRAATPERSFSPSLQMQTVAGPSQMGATGSFAELSAFMEKQQALLLERDDGRGPGDEGCPACPPPCAALTQMADDAMTAAENQSAVASW